MLVFLSIFAIFHRLSFVTIIICFQTENNWNQNCFWVIYIENPNLSKSRYRHILVQSKIIAIRCVCAWADVAVDKPDDKSVITYLALYYTYFAKQKAKAFGMKRIQRVRFIFLKTSILIHVCCNFHLCTPLISCITCFILFNEFIDSERNRGNWPRDR